MTLRQLEAFVAVAREGSFSLAAERIHLSQPTLSEHVAELERELETKLFVRQGRAILLTEAGRVLTEHAAPILAGVAGAHQAISDLAGLTRGSLVVGASTTPGLYVLPHVIAQFRARYPGIKVVLRTGNSRVIEERLRDGECDLGVVGGHVLDPTEPCLAAGLVDELVLVVHPGHADARRRQITPARLAELPIIMREEGSATRQVAERALRQAGIPVRTAMELDHTEAIKQAVMAGLGAAFLSVHAIRGEITTGRLRILQVRGLRLRRHFHVIHDERRPLSPSARAFLGLLETHAAATRQGARRPRGPRRGQRAVARVR